MTEVTQDPAQEPTEPDMGEKALTDAQVEKWKALARKHEAKAKELAPAAQRLADLEAASQSETEKAVTAARREATEQATAAVRAEMGGRLARADFLAAAARRNPEFDATAILEDVNLARYLGDDGEPDAKAIAAAVERLIAPPAASTKPTGSADQGARTTAPPPTDGSPRGLIAAGLAANAAAKPR